jgi:hypothetical protein
MAVAFAVRIKANLHHCVCLISMLIHLKHHLRKLNPINRNCCCFSFIAEGQLQTIVTFMHNDGINFPDYIHSFPQKKTPESWWYEHQTFKGQPVTA